MADTLHILTDTRPSLRDFTVNAVIFDASIVSKYTYSAYT